MGKGSQAGVPEECIYGERNKHQKHIQEQMIRTGAKWGMMLYADFFCSLLLKLQPCPHFSVCVRIREGCEIVKV